MRATWSDSLEFIYGDESPVKREETALQLDVARGGTAAVHLIVQDLSPTARVRVAVQSRPFEKLRLFRLHAVPVPVNTGRIGFTEDTNMGDRGVNRPNPFVARRAPFTVFDPMEPIGATFAANASQICLRLHLPVPHDAKPGLYDCPVTLRAGADRVVLQLRIRIHRATIPPTGRESVPYTNWFSLPSMAAAHGLRPWSAGHWKMIGDYAALMARVRQNTFLVSLKDIFTQRGQRFLLDEKRLCRIVNIFTRAGLHWIEGGHLAHRKGGWASLVYGNILGDAPSTSADGVAALADVTGQLLRAIERHGYRARWLQHVADEPSGVNMPDYRITCGIVRKYMPGITIFDASADPAIVGATDIWCPHVNFFQERIAFYRRQQALGDKLWFYVCCEPGGRWLNRLLDQELLRSTLIGWGAALFGADGFLHWGLNSWYKDQDPFRQTTQSHKGSWPNTLPAGDTHCVYPGPSGPWSSLRLEAQREGMEDWELLRRLFRRDPQGARKLVRRVLRAFNDYSTDLPRFRQARRALLECG